MNQAEQKRIKRSIRHNRVRTKVLGTSQRPRLSVFKSSTHIYAQLIDDNSGITLAQASSLKIKVKGNKANMATFVGKDLAQKALANNISTVVFDRGGYKYHGRVKALAEGAREGGLKF